MKVTFIKHIHGCFASVSSDDVYLIKIIDLPFCPHVDMYFKHGDWCEKAKEIYYDIEKGEFRIYTEPDTEIYNAQLHNRSHRHIDKIVDEYIAIGWNFR